MSDQLQPPQGPPAFPEIEADLDLWQQKIDQMAPVVGDLAGRAQFPDWWLEDRDKIDSLMLRLRHHDVPSATIGRYFELFSANREITAKIQGEKYQHTHFHQLIHDLTPAVAGRALKEEEPGGILHQAMLANLEAKQKILPSLETPYNELECLQEAYGLSTITELLGVRGDDFSDQVRRLMRGGEILRKIIHRDRPIPPGQPWAETQAQTRRWMSQAIQAATGLDAKAADNYAFSAGVYDNVADLQSVLRKFDHFGADRILRLSQGTGIHGLESYTIEQLERMESWLNNPQQLAEKLARHDVTVVMTNRFGDHNGALQPVAEAVEDNHQRTLFFEIKEMADIYKYMAALHKANIRPSTLLLAAHSAPGQFLVTDRRDPDLDLMDVATIAGRRLVEVATADVSLDEKSGQRGYSMHGMRGLARLVENYMQPSRAIDDAATDKDHKKIIFWACSVGTKAAMNDLDPIGEKFQLGLESVIGRLAQDLRDSGVTSTVDIYGAPEGMQAHRTDDGLRFSGMPLPDSNQRTKLHATRERLENGQVTTQTVDNIALRKS